MNYDLDTKAAAAGDVIYSKVEQKGKYLGVLTRAETIKSDKGTTGVDMSFKSDCGATADYLTLWTHNADGKALMGFNTLMAIMTCLRVKSLKAELGHIEKYDPDQQKRVMVGVELFKDVMNKPFGLLLRMEQYKKNAGGTAWKPTIAGAFDKDGFTATEILNKSKTPEILDKMVLALKDKPLADVKPTADTQSNTGAGSGFTDPDFDIPF